MKDISNPRQTRQGNDPVQPGLDPGSTGKPKPSNPSTDQKPGQKKEPGEPGYRPER